MVPRPLAMEEITSSADVGIRYRTFDAICSGLPICSIGSGVFVVVGMPVAHQYGPFFYDCCCLLLW